MRIFSLYKLMFNVCSRFGMQQLTPEFAPMSWLHFTLGTRWSTQIRAWHDDDAEMLIGVFNVDVYAHTAPQKARGSPPARMQQEQKPTSRLWPKACRRIVGLVGVRDRRAAEPTAAALENPLDRMLWTLVRDELLNAPPRTA